MSADIIRHPSFDRPPVVNPKTRGCPRGTASFRTARRRKTYQEQQTKNAMEREVDDVAHDLALSYSYLTVGILLSPGEYARFKQTLIETLADIKAKRPEG